MRGMISPAVVDDFIFDFAPYAALPRGVKLDQHAAENVGIRFVQADPRTETVGFTKAPGRAGYIGVLGAEDQDMLGGVAYAVPFLLVVGGILWVLRMAR